MRRRAGDEGAVLVLFYARLRACPGKGSGRREGLRCRSGPQLRRGGAWPGSAGLARERRRSRRRGRVHGGDRNGGGGGAACERANSRGRWNRERLVGRSGDRRRTSSGKGERRERGAVCWTRRKYNEGNGYGQVTGCAKNGVSTSGVRMRSGAGEECPELTLERQRRRVPTHSSRKNRGMVKSAKSEG